MDFWDNKATKTAASLTTGGASDFFGYGIVDDEIKHQTKKAGVKDRGVLGAVSDKVYGKDDTPDFNAPEMQLYNGALGDYEGKLDGGAGGSALSDAERKAGIKNFDGNAYRDALLGGLEAKMNDGVRRSVNSTVNQGSSRGLGSSEITQALEGEARMAGEVGFAQGAAAIEGDLTQMLLAENADRRGAAVGLTQADLQNKQHGSSYNINRAELDERGRTTDNAMLYGGALDEYINNEVNPRMRDEERKGGLLKAGSSVFGAGTQAAGSIGAAAAPALIAACWIAIACYGADDRRTHAARYHVNNVWVKYALGRVLRNLYLRFGERVAAKVEKSRLLKLAFRVPFGIIWRLGARAQGQVA